MRQRGSGVLHQPLSLIRFQSAGIAGHVHLILADTEDLPERPGRVLHALRASGLYAHFGSKQELQLATVEEAGRIFTDEVVRPALAAPAGLA